MSLGSKALSGTLRVAGGAYLIQLINFIANIALMRLLAPEHFGVLALAMFFLVLGQKLVAFGFNHALIHRQEDLESAAPTHQFLHLISSLIVVLLLLLFGKTIEASYDKITAVAVLVLGVSNIIQSAGHTPRVMLEKELDFKPVIQVNVVNAFASNAIAIALAFAGLGIWALLIRQVLADVIATGGYFAVSKRAFRLKIDSGLITWYLRFGAYLWLGGMATFITLKFDDFLVGTLIDSEQLGFYARAYALACLPTTMVTHVVAKVAFPLYSKLQDDKDRLSEAFDFALRGIVILTLPLAVGLAILAPEFVVLVFGEKWAPMIPMIRLLLIYASMRPIFDNTGELFTALGRPKIAGWILMAQAAAVLVICPPLTYYWGAYGAAVAVGLVMAVGVVLAYRQIPRYVNISYITIFGPPLAAAIIGAVTVLATNPWWTEMGDMGRFFSKGLIFLVAFLVVLAILQGRRLSSEGRRFIMLLKGQQAEIK